MVLPPIAAGYWLAGVGLLCVFIVVLAIIKELCSTITYNQKIDKDREALRGPRTRTPQAAPLSTDDWIFKKSQFLAFTCPYQLSESLIKPTEERRLIRSFFEKLDIDVETLIPKGARTVSYAYDGFEFGKSCLDFRPKSRPERPVNRPRPESLEEPEFLKFTYQMICSRVQNVYCNDILAGTCLYFDITDKADDNKRFTEAEYNLMAFYDTVTQKTRQEVRETRKMEKLARKAERSAEEPLKEYTSTIFSHLRLFTEKNGETVVLACNADGKMEKYAFNEQIDRYEYVETEEVLDEDTADNFLVRRY